MDYLAFLSQEWLLVGTLVALIYIYAFREKVKSGTPVTTQEATELINNEAAIWLDIRDKAEFSAGSMVDAIHIPHAKVANQLAELEGHKDKIIIVVDKIGQQAGTVGRLLGNSGFTVRRLAGGISEWQSQNLPLVKR